MCDRVEFQRMLHRIDESIFRGLGYPSDWCGLEEETLVEIVNVVKNYLGDSK